MGHVVNYPAQALNKGHTKLLDPIRKEEQPCLNLNPLLLELFTKTEE